MSYSHAVPRSRSGGGGFSHFLLLLVLLAIVGSTLVVMSSHAAKRPIVALSVLGRRSRAEGSGGFLVVAMKNERARTSAIIISSKLISPQGIMADSPLGKH